MAGYFVLNRNNLGVRKVFKKAHNQRFYKLGMDIDCI